jgi:hypothetical protein
MALPLLLPALAASGPAAASLAGAVGSAFAALNSSSKATKRNLLLLSAGLGILAWRSVRDFIDNAPDEDSVLGAASRLLGNEEDPGTIKDSTPSSPFEVPTSTSTNVLLLRGQFIEPIEGTRVDLPFFADTYPVKVAIENGGGSTVTGRIRINVREDGIFDSEANYYTDPVALRPGESRTFTVRVGEAGSNLTLSVDVEARLYFDDKLLATGYWERD